MLAPDGIQAEAIHGAINTTSQGGIFAFGTGVGKTLAGVEVARLKGAKRVLIIGPSSTLDGWYSTVFWQTGEKVRWCANKGAEIRFTPDPGNRDRTETVKVDAKTARSNLAAVQNGEDGWFFVTREFFTTQNWTKKPITKDGAPVIDPKTGKPKTRAVRTDIFTRRRKLDILLSDEHQRFAKSGNRGQQAFEHADADFKLVLSADWFGADMMNMWRVCRDTFGPEAGVGGLNFHSWRDEWFETVFDPFTWDKKKATGEKIPGLFVTTLPVYFAAAPTVQAPEPEKVYVPLSPAETKAYRALEDDMVAEVPDGLLVAEMPLTLRIRLRELSLALVSPVIDPNTGKWTIEYRPGAPSAKLDAIKEILADHPGKHLIATHSKKWADWAARELREAGIKAAARTGDTHDRQRQADLNEFKDGDLRVIVATPGTLAEGADGLQRVCHRMIFASLDDQSLMNTQFAGRIARRGQEHEVVIQSLISPGTFDAGVLSSQMKAALERSVAKGQTTKEGK